MFVWWASFLTVFYVLNVLWLCDIKLGGVRHWYRYNQVYLLVDILFKVLVHISENFILHEFDCMVLYNCKKEVCDGQYTVTSGQKWHYQALVLLQVCAAAVRAFVFGSAGVKPRTEAEFHWRGGRSTERSFSVVPVATALEQHYYQKCTVLQENIVRVWN